MWRVHARTAALSRASPASFPAMLVQTRRPLSAAPRENKSARRPETKQQKGDRQQRRSDFFHNNKNKDNKNGNLQQKQLKAMLCNAVFGPGAKTFEILKHAPVSIEGVEAAERLLGQSGLTNSNNNSNNNNNERGSWSDMHLSMVLGWWQRAGRPDRGISLFENVYGPLDNLSANNSSAAASGSSGKATGLSRLKPVVWTKTLALVCRLLHDVRRWKEVGVVVDEAIALGAADDFVFARGLDAANKLGDVERAMHLYEIMCQGNSAGLKPTTWTFTSLVNACAHHGHWERACQLVLDDYTKLVEQPTFHAFNAAISACAQAGQTEMARKVFYAMGVHGISRNADTYTAMIRALGHGEEAITAALALVDAAALEGVRPDAKMQASIFQMLVGSAKWAEADRHLDQMLASGVSPTPICWAETIVERKRLSDMSSAIKMYQRAVEEFGCLHCAPTNSAIHVAGEEDWQAALKVFQYAQQRNVVMDSTSYSLIINILSREHQFSAARNILQVMNDRGVVPSAKVYTALLFACAGDGHWKRAEELFDHMVSDGYEVEAGSVAAVMIALTNASKWERAIKLFERMREQNVPMNSVSYTAAIKAYQKGRLADKAVGLLFEYMDTRSTMPSIQTFGVALSCASECARWDLTTDILERMKAKGVTPDAIAYAAAVVSGLRVGRPSEALEILEEAMSGDVSLDMRLCQAAVETYHALSRPADVVAILRRMIQSDSPRDGVLYSKAIDACANTEHLSTVLELMSEDGITPVTPTTERAKILPPSAQAHVRPVPAPQREIY